MLWLTRSLRWVTGTPGTSTIFRATQNASALEQVFGQATLPLRATQPLTNGGVQSICGFVLLQIPIFLKTLGGDYRENVFDGKI